MSKTLHLVLTGKWYDKIASGEKTSEYRECKPYWNKRFLGDWYKPKHRDYAHDNNSYVANPDLFDRVVFHKGYTATTMEFEIEFIGTTTAPNDLGLDKCWEIKLGQRITKGGDNE